MNTTQFLIADLQTYHPNNPSMVNRAISVENNLRSKRYGVKGVGLLTGFLEIREGTEWLDRYKSKDFSNTQYADLAKHLNDTEVIKADLETTIDGMFLPAYENIQRLESMGYIEDRKLYTQYM